jgi:FkbM family methyltransferase
MLARFSKMGRYLLNSQLCKRGYTLKWTPPAVLSHPRHVMELDFSMCAAHLMLTKRTPFFIGIGANDGVTHDPLYPFVRDFGWRGIMVEPVPEAFKELERNYAKFRDVTLVQAAIGPIDGRGKIYSVDMAAENSMMMTLHSSFDKDILLRGRRWHPGLEASIVEREVSLMSFQSLLSKTNGEVVDVLKIDTEGFDLEILKGVDLAQLSPKLILAEQANLSRHDKIVMADILLQHGYQVSMTRLDMLGYKSAEP